MIIAIANYSKKEKEKGNNNTTSKDIGRRTFGSRRALIDQEVGKRAVDESIGNPRPHYRLLSHTRRHLANVQLSSFAPTLRHDEGRVEVMQLPHACLSCLLSHFRESTIHLCYLLRQKLITENGRENKQMRKEKNERDAF